MRSSTNTIDFSLFLLDDLSSSSDNTSSSSGDETNLLTSGDVSSHCGWVTNMLMVTTTMRMLDGVHCDTSNSWPVVSLSSSLEPGVGGLKEWFIGSLSTGANSNHGSAVTKDGLSGAGWESDSGLLSIFGVTNNNGGGSGSSGERSSISKFTFAVGNDSSFWHRVNWKNITNAEGSLGTGIDELASVHAFDGDEILNSLLVSVCVSECDLGEWSSST
jgi:hypothetical protein